MNLLLWGITSAGEVRISGADGRTKAYLDERGRISAPDGRTIGYIERNDRIARPDGSTAGYIEGDEDTERSEGRGLRGNPEVAPPRGWLR